MKGKKRTAAQGTFCNKKASNKDALQFVDKTKKEPYTRSGKFPLRIFYSSGFASDCQLFKKIIVEVQKIEA